jgi:hypothetical protein
MDVQLLLGNIVVLWNFLTIVHSIVRMDGDDLEYLISESQSQGRGG